MTTEQGAFGSGRAHSEVAYQPKVQSEDQH